MAARSRKPRRRSDSRASDVPNLSQLMRYYLAVLGKRPTAIVALLALVMLSFAAVARKQHHPTESTGSFDYYVLSLSWAPTYCADHPSDNSTECRSSQKKAFVLHGLWPQSQGGAPPENCGSASPVSQQ